MAYWESISASDAITRLDAAFAGRDTHDAEATQPRVGIFGNGFPETLVAAAGAIPVHVSLGHPGAASGIDAVIEPFVDDEVRTFLNRLMRGDFANCRGIMFARDDAPALIAYQYATEWVRQGRAPASVPPLFLWNLVHADTPAVQKFNAIQAEKLFDFLATIGLDHPTQQTIAHAASAEAERFAALEALANAVSDSLSGTTAMRWRNAGRFIPAKEHTRLLNAAMAEPSGPNTQGQRLGIVGSPLACTETYAMIERFGPIVCDLQPLGSVWPGRGNSGQTLETILEATAADASCPRIAKTTAYRAAMLDALTATKCDLVICQLAQTDDTFGWEIPALSSELANRGIGFLNLGFRDSRPDEAWRNAAADRIAAALEARK